jgi:hypothetical protein
MLFIRAATKCVWRVLSDIGGALGALLTIFGIFAEAMEWRIVMPNWGWIALGALLLFITACKIEMELMEECEKNRKPEPNLPLAAVLKRITGFDSVMPLSGEQPGKADATANALIEIRQKAVLGKLSVFARRGDRPILAHQDPSPLLALPVDIWNDHEIYYLALLTDSRGQIRKQFQRDETVEYSDVWFDTIQLKEVWPEKRGKISFRSPFVRETA